MKAPTMIHATLPDLSVISLTCRQAKKLIDDIYSKMYDSWEWQEEDVRVNEFLAKFEVSDKQLPNELFLPKSKL